MTLASSIVMTRVIANCDDKCHGALCDIDHLGIVMKGIMEHCDENCPGLL